MAKQKTTRRWSGAGDGLVHAYEVITFLGINPDTGEKDWDHAQRMVRTYCGLVMTPDDRGVWCRRSVTCLECLAEPMVFRNTAELDWPWNKEAMSS